MDGGRAWIGSSSGATEDLFVAGGLDRWVGQALLSLLKRLAGDLVLQAQKVDGTGVDRSVSVAGRLYGVIGWSFKRCRVSLRGVVKCERRLWGRRAI